MTYEEAGVMRDTLMEARNSLDEMNDQDILLLQRMMEQMSQLETMISNVMKAASDTQSSLTTNAKAS